MATLAGSFPAELARGRIRAQLSTGVVVKFRALMDDNRVKEKRFVILQCTDDLVACVINSQISTFIASRPRMMQCQVAMAAADFPFMSHDSHVDCSQVKTYRIDQVIGELIGQPDWILGPINGRLRDDIVSALKYSPTLSVDACQALCEALEAAQLT